MMIIDCAIAVIYHPKTQHLLISKRFEGDTFGGFWEFPGGKLNPGETPEECVIREVREEVGLNVTVERLVKVIESESAEHLLKLHFFECITDQIEPAALECAAVKWIKPETLTEYNFPPANEKIISHILKTTVCN